jgi:hypothetical protein
VIVEDADGVDLAVGAQRVHIFLQGPVIAEGQRGRHGVRQDPGLNIGGLGDLALVLALVVERHEQAGDDQDHDAGRHYDQSQAIRKAE